MISYRFTQVLLIFIVGALTGCSTSSLDPISQSSKNSASKCSIIAHSAAWENFYCTQKTGILLSTSEVLIQCETNIHKELRKTDDCQKKIHLKNKICDLQRGLGYYKKSQDACLEDKEIEAKWMQKYL